MKLKYLYFSLLLIITGILFLNALEIQNDDSKKSNKDIIKFSHQFHKELAECKDCHKAVTQSTSLKDRLMPNHENCSECHDVDDSQQCGTCHYDDVYEPLIQNTSDLLFNHKFHLDDQKLKCEDCHKNFGGIDYGAELTSPDPLMKDCYSCHNGQTVASNACESCHISTADLKPQSHRNTSFITSHKFASREFDADCIMCHNNSTNSCQECHDATTAITEENTADNFYAPYAPSPSIDGPKQQRITRVHELNYRFIHGIDAKGKTVECQSCHQLETFCANCHQSEGGDFALSGIEPVSHFKPNFTTFGVGSGGGEHAVLARRDIESCISCHDAQGADPACMNCHLDNDGIKGTNPRTHPANFMRDEHGDWHDNQGSICFNCHTVNLATAQAGIGFCGYCHGGQVE
jgi:hypothetical protein